MLTGISGWTAKNFKKFKNTYQSNSFSSNFFLRMKGTLQPHKSTLEEALDINELRNKDYEISIDNAFHFVNNKI